MMRAWRSVGVDGPRRHRSARMRSLKITFEGAVHDHDSTDWNRYVEERFPAAWRRRARASVIATQAAASGVPDGRGQARADVDRAGGVRRQPLLGARAAGAGSPGDADPAAVREALRWAQQERQGRRR